MLDIIKWFILNPEINLSGFVKRFEGYPGLSRSSILNKINSDSLKEEEIRFLFKEIEEFVEEMHEKFN